MVSKLNSLGIAVLVAICILQWAKDRGLQADLRAMEKLAEERLAALDEKDRIIQGQLDDLDSFREKTLALRESLDQAEAELAEATRRLGGSDVDPESLSTRLEEWRSAVSEREVALAEYAARIEELVLELNERTDAYNELAATSNDYVERLETRNREYNELVEKYNRLVR